MASSDVATMVTLRAGHVVDLEVLRLLWSLEDRGFTLERLAGKLRVQPASALTAADVAAIKEYRDELLTIVAYVDKETEQ